MNFIRIKEHRNNLDYEERLENIKIKNENEIDISWIDTNLVNIANVNELYGELFRVEEHLHELYLLESEIIVQF